MLHEDADVLAVSKPPGMAVHGGAGEKKSVIALLHQAYPKRQELHLVHRLDKDTSGVLLVAKSASVARTLGRLWDRYRKTYLAIVLGVLEEQTIDRPLLDKEGKARAARTVVRVIASEGDLTLVSAEIETGRTHQIRRHLASIGHPIMMDDKHGDFAANKALAKRVRDRGGTRPKHTLLHAYRLAGPHPVTSEPLALVSPPPAEWREILGRVDALDHLPYDAPGGS